MARKDWPDWGVYVRDRCRCIYCGLSGRDNIGLWKQLVIDHIVPKKKDGNEYGSDDALNKAVSCHRCNTLKGDYDPSEGKPDAVRDPEERNKLIVKIRAYLRDHRLTKEEALDFLEMMVEIDAGRGETKSLGG